MGTKWAQRHKTDRFLGTNLVARRRRAVFTAIPINCGTAIISKNYYINPVEFKADLSAYREEQTADKLNELCRRFFYPLASRSIWKFGCGYADFDDLVQESVSACAGRVLLFDPARGTPFNFFTKIIHNKVRDVRRTAGRRATRESPLYEMYEREY